MDINISYKRDSEESRNDFFDICLPDAPFCGVRSVSGLFVNDLAIMNYTMGSYVHCSDIQAGRSVLTVC